MLTDLAFGINGELLVVDSAAHKVQSFETPFYIEPKVTELIEIVEPEITEEFLNQIKLILQSWPQVTWY